MFDVQYEIIIDAHIAPVVRSEISAVREAFVHVPRITVSADAIGVCWRYGEERAGKYKCG